MNWLDWAWLILTFVCVVLELLTYGIFFVLFAVGALAAFVVALWTPSVAIQVVVFAVVTIACLLFLRPAVRKWLKLGKYGNDVTTPDYIEQYQGKQGVVTKAIAKDSKGEVKIGSEMWTARSNTGVAIAEGVDIFILRIEGVTAVVEPKRNSALGLKSGSKEETQ